MKKLPKSQSGFTAVEGLLILLILVVIGGVGYTVYKNHNKTNVSSSHSQTSTTSLAPKSDICSIKTPNIVCIDQTGGNLTVHTLPSVNNELIEQFAPNPSDTTYVAYTDHSHLYLLDQKLSEISQINTPSGLTYTPGSIPSWSHDGKSLVMELDTSDNSSSNWRQIYHYDIITQKWTQLTSSNLAQDPFQTADGHIVYLYMNGDFHTNTSGWEPYIMDSDGTNAKPFTSYVNSSDYSAAYTADASPSLDLNYDMATDTVFVDPSSSPLSYETVSDLLSGKQPHTIQVSGMQGSVFAGTLTRVSSIQLLFITSKGENQPIEAEFIAMSSGNVAHTINNFGPYIIGVLPHADDL